MPYALRFYLYFFVACVVVTVVAVWLRPYGLLDKCQYLSVRVDANTWMSVESMTFD